MKKTVVGGSLKFKGNFQKKLVQQNQTAKQILERREERQVGLLQQIPDTEVQQTTKIISFEPKMATGRILSSEKILTGMGTKFLSEAEYGDLIIVTIDEANFKKESRKVVLVTSDKSLSMDQGFSRNLSAYVRFEIQKADKEVLEDATTEQKYSEIMNIQRKGIEKKKSVIEVREKSGMWGYTTKKYEFERELTREEMLDLRVKNKKFQL